MTATILLGDAAGNQCGRRKVHPEEVETALNAHAIVRASRVFARTSAITGALVFADVVLRDGCWLTRTSEGQILAACRASLPPHMVPAGLRFVADLPMTEGGKLTRVFTAELGGGGDGAGLVLTAQPVAKADWAQGYRT